MAGRDKQEYKVHALNPVGNYLGGCYLRLSRDDISVYDNTKGFLGKWPYNCIRQFREEKDVFAFTSGRRGPFGVSEYQFQMAPERLAHLKQIVSDYTGAKFQSFDDGPVSSDEILPYQHESSPPGVNRSARRSSSSKSDKGTPSPKVRSRSSSRQKTDSTSSSGNSYDKSPVMKMRAESVQPLPAASLRTMFSSARQMSLPDTSVRSTTLHSNAGRFQSDLKTALSNAKVSPEGPAHGYVNGQAAVIQNLKTSPKMSRWSRSSDTSPDVSPPRDLPPKPPRSSIPPPVARKPVGIPHRFLPAGQRSGPNGARLRKARSMGSLLDACDEEGVGEDSVGEMLLDEDVVFGSMKDQHHFGSRVSPRQTPSPGPTSSPTPMDDYVHMNGTSRPPVSKPIPAPRRRSATVNKISYENADIVLLHKNGLLRKQMKGLPADTRQPVAQGNQDVFDGQLSPDFSLDDYEQMASLKQHDTDDYVMMKSAHIPDEYEMMQSHFVGRKKIQKYSDVPPPVVRLQKSNSAHNLLSDMVYDTPRNAGIVPMARSGYDHLATPGIKSGKGGKRSILLQKDANNPFKGQPKKHIVTAC